MSRPAETISCGEVRDLLEAHLDGDLGRDQVASVAAHLASCAACAAEAKLAAKVRAELRALPSLDAPPSVLARVRWTTVSKQSRRWLRPASVAAAAAAAVVALALGVLWPDRSRPSLDDPEIARATAETRYALALVGAVGRQAALEELLGQRVLSPTVKGLARSLRRGLAGTEDGSRAVSEHEIEHQPGGTE